MKRVMLLAVAVTLLFVGNAFGEVKKEAQIKNGKKCEKMTMSPEIREKKAKMFEAMAVCLRSSKPMKECRREMKATVYEEMAACLHSTKSVEECHKEMKQLKGMMGKHWHGHDKNQKEMNEKMD
jgi:hypothetical protein